MHYTLYRMLAYFWPHLDGNYVISHILWRIMQYKTLTFSIQLMPCVILFKSSGLSASVPNPPFNHFIAATWAVNQLYQNLPPSKLPHELTTRAPKIHISTPTLTRNGSHPHRHFGFPSTELTTLCIDRALFPHQYFGFPSTELTTLSIVQPLSPEET